MEEGKKAGFGMNQASSAQPDIEAVEIKAGDRFVIIGTQELWQVMTSWEAVQLVAGLLPHKRTSLCESLITEAQKRWEEIGGCVAEITVIIALFGP
jgi:serine/threonine protein phosphatase PrpC